MLIFIPLFYTPTVSDKEPCILRTHTHKHSHLHTPTTHAHSHLYTLSYSLMHTRTQHTRRASKKKIKSIQIEPRYKDEKLRDYLFAKYTYNFLTFLFRLQLMERSWFNIRRRWKRSDGGDELS